MKKIMSLAASIILILIAGIFAGAGTIAYFSDTENAGNPNFRAKILDIKVHSFELPVKFAPGEKQQSIIEVEVPSYSMQPDHIEFRIWADKSTFYDWPGESGGTNGPRLLLRYIKIPWATWWPDSEKVFSQNIIWPDKQLTMEKGYHSDTGEYWIWATHFGGYGPPDPGTSGKLVLTIEFDSAAPNKLQGDSIVLHLDVAADQVAGQNQLKCAP